MDTPKPQNRIDLSPLTPKFGAEIDGVDISRPLADETMADIAAAFASNGVIALRSQRLEPDDLVAFSRGFGELVPPTDTEYLLPGHPQVMAVGNVNIEGKVRSFFHNAKEEWHTDLIQMQEPNVATLLYAVEAPPSGGETRFADTRRAYDDLSEGTKTELDGLRVVYDIKIFDQEMRRHDPGRPPLSQEKIDRHPPVSHPLVRTHPVTGARALYFAPEVMSHVEGWSREASKLLIADLLAHATQPHYLYEHHWRVGDVVIWDNRSTLHTATPFEADKYKRLLYRTLMAPEEPV